ncbi:hypothetical protein FOBRF1_010886 [Fusarium oxysporum]
MVFYQYDVKMACIGCATAVNKAVNAHADVESVETSVEEQKVTVIASDDQSFEAIRAAISKSGKVIMGGRELKDGGNVEMAL